MAFKRRYTFFFLIFLILFFLSFLFFDVIKKISRENLIFHKTFKIQEVWLNIFVHGTVSSALSFMDLNATSSDRLKSSVYKTATSMARKEKLFRRDILLSDKGFLKLDPSFDHNVFSATNSIIKGFDIVDEFYSGFFTANMYYTFGWTGLVSQEYRRKDSVRFFNGLSLEVQRLKLAGINPKIRIIAYSHGGNVALNLAGIDNWFKSDLEKTKFYQKFEIGSQISQAFDQMLSQSPLRSEKKNQKSLFFKPEKNDFKVDQLILLGCPIQEETKLFFHSNFFKHIVNLYSAQDYVQDADVISTSKPSAKRVNVAEFDLSKKVDQIQVKIDDLMCADESREFIEQSQAKWWEIVFGLKNTLRKGLDPTHKEFWCIIPEAERINFISPIPIVVFVPVILKLLSKVSAKNDFDFKFLKNPVQNFLEAYRHESRAPLGRIEIPKEIFDTLQEEFLFRASKVDDADFIMSLITQIIRQARSKHNK